MTVAPPPPPPLGASTRLSASESEATALYTSRSPLEEVSPYHAFARCPPTALFGKPRQWPGPEGTATTARLLWNEAALYVCWELEGRTASPTPAERVASGVLEALEGGKVQPDQRTVLLDERVECFLWQPSPGNPGKESDGHPAKRVKVDWPHAGETYFAFEINYAGKALTNKAKFRGPMGFDWGGEAAYTAWTREMPVGWGSISSPVPGDSYGGPPFKRVVIAELKWPPMGIDTKREVRIGLFRAEYPSLPPSCGQGQAVMGQAEVDTLLAEMVWTSWVEPGDAQVNFHRPDLFGRLVLAPASSTLDNSCKAARLVKPRELRIITSPKPSISECPPGSLIVQAKYASICGSDLPYVKSREFMPPSCYWDRDGFCAHEVIGIVLESKSGKFQPGDPVMALPSAYFKAHCGSKQDWYREEIHGVLLQDFPVRGGFSQVYTSHELYAYKLKECVPRMLAAQALGTVLKLARKLGSVLGKVVVIQGQGQNGLIATRLMSQLCAKAVIAVEDKEYRRAHALKFGATAAVSTDEAPAAIAAASNGLGADVVLEMVGHNQDTINTCLDYVACGGVVAAFGVPDDRIYDHFEYSKFFRKNVTLIASVVPDPGVDFPEAVKLIDEGRFSTEGIFTHVLQLADVQKAFTMAAGCEDGVVKAVIEVS